MGFWVTCGWGVKMMSLCHDWGWWPPKTVSCIHINHIQSVCAHWYTVHWHMVAARHSFTHPTRLRLWGSGVKMVSLCHGWGWQAPQTASHIHIGHVQSVWAHWYAVHRQMVAALHSYTHPTWLRFWCAWHEPIILFHTNHTFGAPS